MKLRFFLLACLAPSLALAQGTSVLQSGSITPRHGAMWTANGVIQDAGPALGGPAGINFSELGITSTGTPFCITDKPITGPYHQLCLGALSAGGGLITYGAFGGAPVLPMNCIINGVTTSNCLSGGSSGTPAGPVDSVQFNAGSIFGGTSALVLGSAGLLPLIATDNKTGAITQIGSAITAANQPGITGDLIESYVFCTAPGTAASCGGGNYDALAGVAVSNAGTTTNLITGVAGYVVANQPFSGSGPFSVALFGTGAVSADGGRVEGLNVNVSDRQYRVAQPSGAHNRLIVGAELDVSASYPDSSITGILLAGNSVVQPNNSTAISVVGQDFSAPTPGSIAKWSQVFFAADGVATHFGLIGTATSSTVNSDSEDILPHAFVNSVSYQGQFYFGTAHSPNFGSTVSPSFNMNYPLQTMTGGITARNATDQIIQLAGHVDLSSGAAILSRNDADSSLEPLEILSSQLDLRSTTQLTINGTPSVNCSGTPSSSFATINGIVTHC